MCKPSPTNRHAEAVVAYEAVCGRCAETFNPHGPTIEELRHDVRARDGVECGGYGVLLGSWR